MSYGSFHARGQISCNCQPTPQPQQHQIFNPLSEARDQTCILMDTSWVPNPLSHNGNSDESILKGLFNVAKVLNRVYLYEYNLIKFLLFHKKESTANLICH